MDEFSACVSNFSTQMAELGFNIPELYPFFPSPKNTFCAAVRRNSFLIRPDGSIGKCFDCEQSVGDVFRGIAYDSTTKANLSQWLDFHPFDDSECNNCPVLPICLGGCPFFHIFRLKKLCLKWKDDLPDSLRQIFYWKGGASSWLLSFHPSSLLTILAPLIFACPLKLSFRALLSGTVFEIKRLDLIVGAFCFFISIPFVLKKFGAPFLFYFFYL